MDTLKEIILKRQDIIDKIIENEGEITEELDMLLNNNDYELTMKIENYGFVLLRMEDEINRLKELKKLVDSKIINIDEKIDKMKSYLHYYMDKIGIEKVKGTLLSISKRVSITHKADLEKLEPQYKKYSITNIPYEVYKNLINSEYGEILKLHTKESANVSEIPDGVEGKIEILRPTITVRK